ncbi:hypothetical protein ACFL0M_07550, partial [Thermodesulfobacteriota bacterium]
TTAAYMISVKRLSIIFGIGYIVSSGKELGIQHSSVLFFSVSFFATLNLFMILFLLAFRKIRFKTFKNTPLKGIIAGSLLFVHVLLHAFAISLTTAAYMISVKRLSIIFGIVYGGALFKEKNIIIRFFGALLMITGAVIITLKG